MEKDGMAKRPAQRRVSPEEILADHAPPVRELAETLRGIVRAEVPEASEAGYPGWHGFGYRHPRAGYFGVIFPYADTVSIFALTKDKGGGVGWLGERRHGAFRRGRMVMRDTRAPEG